MTYVWGLSWKNPETGAVGRGVSGFTSSREEALRVCRDLDRQFPYLRHEPEVKVAEE